jgi:hypothetical protein
MGLALDEPREGDESYTVEELPLIVDPFALKIIRESGGIAIKHGIFGPMAELAGVAAAGGGCGCS